MSGSARRDRLDPSGRNGWAGAVFVLFCVRPDPSLAQQPTPTPTPPARSISASVERVVERLERERPDSCHRAAAEGIPCFPVAVEAQGRRYSVADSLREISSDKSPAPDRPPTIDEMRGARSGALGLPGGVSFDPVCAGKSILKRIRGKNDVYYLYRVFDRGGPRVAMLDHPLKPGSIAREAEWEYEFLGQYDGECEAVAAYRRAERAGTPGRGDATPSSAPPKNP